MEIKFKDGNNEITILKPEYVGLITGKEGSGKTQLVESIVTAFLGGQSDYFTVSNIKPGTKCLRIDTEQPQDLIDKSNNRLRKLTNSKLENYEALALTDVGTARQRWEIIKEKVNNDNSIGLIIIDNLSGVCTSVNNDQEAVAITSFLSKIAKDNGVIVISISHAAADGTPLGHVGKAQARGCSFHLMLTYDSKDGITYCNPGKTRLDKIPPFTFTINQETKQVVKGVYTPFPIS